MLILLLESDRLLAKNITRSLGSAGHRVINIVQPEVAIETADIKKPELVIMDLQLAGRSGVEFLFEFKSYPEWAAVPIIIYTNLPQAEGKKYLDALSKMDIRHYFYKPATNLAQIEQAVSQLVS